MKVINKTGSINYFGESVSKRSLYIQPNYPEYWDCKLLYEVIVNFFGTHIESITLRNTDSQSGTRPTRQTFDLVFRVNREMSKKEINRTMISIEALVEYLLPVTVVNQGHKNSNGLPSTLRIHLRKSKANVARSVLRDVIMDTIDQIREEKLTNENR